MAGTRLIVHTSFLIPFVVLTVVALYFGLSDQLLPLIQGGRSLLQDDMLLLDPTEFPIPTLSLVAADSQIVFWKNIVKQTKNNHVHLELVHDHGHLERVCEDSDEDDDDFTAEADVWLCEHFVPRTQPRLIIRNGAVVFYPTKLSARQSEFQAALGPWKTRDDGHHDRAKWKLTVAMDSNLDWKDVMDAVNAWQRTVTSSLESLSSWPCGNDGMPNEIRLVFVDWARHVKHHVDPTTNQTVHLLALQYIQSSDTLVHDDTTTWHSILYVPTKHPLTLIDEHVTSSPTAILENHGGMVMVLQGAQQPAQDTDQFELIQAALDTLRNVWMTHCLGLPNNDNMMIETDGSLPRYFDELWWSRHLQDTHRTIVVALNRERQGLLAKPYAVPRTVANLWVEAVQAVQRAVNVTDQGDYTAARAEYQYAQECLVHLQTDPVEPILLDSFPLDQLVAILAPLLFPLLLPLVSGMVREVKRYRKLSKKNP